MSTASAKALQDRQRHYDELHHLMRIEWLQGGKPRNAEGTSMPKHEALKLLNGSKECLCLIQQHGMSTNSVDLGDAEYLSKLDAFAAAQQTLEAA